MGILEEETLHRAPGLNLPKFVILLVLFLGAVALAYYFIQQTGETEDTAVQVTAQPAKTKVKRAEPTVKPKSALPLVGSLSIWASVDGAAVYLDDKRVGDVPYNDSKIAAKSYQLRIENDGYYTFSKVIKVESGRHAAVEATLVPVLASVRVISDIVGATVFLDRKYVGETPLELDDIKPGQHDLTVSAEGYEVYAKSLSLELGEREIVVNFRDLLLEEYVSVVHKHRFGSCEGTLVAKASGISYETTHRDAFAISFGQLQRFAVDYGKKNLNLRVQGSRNYNFTEKNGEADPLFLFHKNVEKFIERQQKLP